MLEAGDDRPKCDKNITDDYISHGHILLDQEVKFQKTTRAFVIAYENVLTRHSCSQWPRQFAIGRRYAYISAGSSEGSASRRYERDRHIVKIEGHGLWKKRSKQHEL